MRTSFLLSVLLSFFSLSAAQETIKQSHLKEHVYYLASEELKGRDSGTEGQKKAAAYIAAQFKKAGLKTFPGGSEDYYQKFVLTKKNLASGYLYSAKDSFFVNYISSKEPQTENQKFLLIPPKAEVPAGNLETTAVIIPESLKKLNESAEKLEAENFKQILVIIRESSVRPYFNHYKKNMARLHLQNKLSENYFEEIEKLSSEIDFIFLPEADFASLFNLDEAQADKLLTAREVIPLEGQVRNRYRATESKEIETENVVAYIEGKDRENCIVITAHYDHIGETTKGINYGADDNASGTAALIELAKAFAHSETPPEKSIVFLAVSAEELGLWGSKYFTESPWFDTFNYVLNINMDMIGKSVKYNMISAMALRESKDFSEDTTLREDYVYLNGYGKKTSALIRQSKRFARKTYDFKVDRTPGVLVRMTYKVASDHYNFAQKNVPVLVFFTGLHPDYHSPRDTPEKLDYENMTIIAKIIYHSIQRRMKM